MTIHLTGDPDMTPVMIAILILGGTFFAYALGERIVRAVENVKIARTTGEDPRAIHVTADGDGADRLIDRLNFTGNPTGGSKD